MYIKLRILFSLSLESLRVWTNFDTSRDLGVLFFMGMVILGHYWGWGNFIKKIWGKEDLEFLIHWNFCNYNFLEMGISGCMCSLPSSLETINS